MLTQSLAIIEWLDETHPRPPLLPSDAAGRARVRALALAIACDIHPLNNLRVLNYLTGTLGVTEAQKNGWYRYWCDVGLEALETQLARDPATGAFCHGDLADARRHLPRSAARQRAPRRSRPRALSDAARDRGRVPRAAGVRGRGAGPTSEPDARIRFQDHDGLLMTTVFPAWDLPTVPVAGTAGLFPSATSTASDATTPSTRRRWAATRPRSRRSSS